MMESPREVVITDVKMPFWSIVVLMVKWAIAAIPAIIILSLLSMAVMFVITAMFGGTFNMPGGMLH
jgi:hypothetical protein